MNVDARFGEIQRRAVMLEPMALRHVVREVRRRDDAVQSTTRLVDKTLEDSFPASDPPSWTSGVARPAPRDPATDAGAMKRILRRVAAMF
jgi:hypothetical protein